jgi:hypothetical protein
MSLTVPIQVRLGGSWRFGPVLGAIYHNLSLRQTAQEYSLMIGGFTGKPRPNAAESVG